MSRDRPGPEVLFNLGIRLMVDGGKPEPLHRQMPEQSPQDGFLPVHGTTNQKSLGTVFTGMYCWRFDRPNWPAARKAVVLLVRWNVEQGLMSLPINKAKGGGAGGEYGPSHNIQHWGHLLGARHLALITGDAELLDLTARLMRSIAALLILAYEPEADFAVVAGPRDYKVDRLGDPDKRANLFGDRGGDAMAGDLYDRLLGRPFHVRPGDLAGADGTGPYLWRGLLLSGNLCSPLEIPARPSSADLPIMAAGDDLAIGIRAGARAMWMRTPPGGNMTDPGPRVATKWSREKGPEAWSENPKLADPARQWYHRSDPAHPGPWTEDWSVVYLTPSAGGAASPPSSAGQPESPGQPVTPPRVGSAPATPSGRTPAAIAADLERLLGILREIAVVRPAARTAVTQAADILQPLVAEVAALEGSEDGAGNELDRDGHH